MQRCFADVNGGKPENRTAYTCQSCNESSFICEKCAKNCHAGHRVVYVGDKKFVCGCYMGYCGKCKISKSAQNENIKKEGNQNFTVPNQTNKTSIQLKEEQKQSSSYHNVYSNNGKNESLDSSPNQSINSQITYNEDTKVKLSDKEKTFYKEECESLSSFLSKQVASKASAPKEEPKSSTSYSYVYSNKDTNKSLDSLPSNQSTKYTASHNDGKKERLPDNKKTFYKEECESLSSFLSRQAASAPKEEPKSSTSYSYVYSNKDKNESLNTSSSKQTNNVDSQNEKTKAKLSDNEKTFYKEECESLSSFLSRQAASKASTAKEEPKPSSSNNYSSSNIKDSEKKQPRSNSSNTSQSYQKSNFSDAYTEQKFDDAFNKFIMSQVMMNPLWLPSISNPYGIEMTANLMMMNPIYLLPTGLPQQDYPFFIEHFKKRMNEQIKQNQQQTNPTNSYQKPTYTYTQPDYFSGQYSYPKQGNQTKTVYQNNSDDDDDDYDVFIYQGKEKTPNKPNKEKQESQKSANKQQNYTKNAKNTKPPPERRAPTCEYEFCDNPPLNGYKYCHEHKCTVDGCGNRRFKTDCYKLLPCCRAHKCAKEFCHNQKMDKYYYCEKCKCHHDGCGFISKPFYSFCERHYCAVSYKKCQNERIDSKCKYCYEHKCAECNDQKVNDSRAKYCRRHTCSKGGCYDHVVKNKSFCYKHLTKH